MAEVLSMPFMQRAMIAGVLISAAASYFGVFVVQRRLSFLASGLAHAAFGGVALGILLWEESLLIAIPFTIAIALAIKWVQEKSALAPDTAIGIFFAVSMALGIVFLSKTDQYASDAVAFLFGSILSVRWADVAAAGLLALLCGAAAPMWSRWAYATLDPELAQADGLNTRKHDYILFVLLAIFIVVSIRVVGIVLIGAFAVIPAAAARLVSTTLASMTIAAIALGVGTTIAGLLLSIQLDLPSGASIILCQAVVFFVLMGARKK